MSTSHSELNGLRQFDNLGFSVSDLSSALFHIKDIEAFEARHPELFQQGKPPQPDQDDAVLEAQLAQARQEIERLTQDNERLTLEVQCLKAGNGKPAPTQSAILANKRKQARALVERIGDAAKLAHAVTSEGPTRGGHPWTEQELKAKADEIGVKLRGDAWKSFKGGMPSTLVKKDAGARASVPKNPPVTPEESPGNVASED
ncbi:MAG: hypothetical protein ACOZEN_07210 [Thermodesulfobacteriota bacterium]